MVGKKVKLSVVADDVILYMESPKVFTQKLLELINDFSKVAGCKINIQKFLQFLYTNNIRNIRQEKFFKILKNNPQISSKRIKYLGVNLTKKVKDFYAKN